MKTLAKAAEPADSADRAERIGQVRPLYLEALTLVERLHRRLLDVIKDEFDRRGRSDINSVQALLL
ncbi:MAG TPA: MarR family transcriptional regulator, partial [Xanthobacteraceae bacterium]|nr:MarR family transcriptional regulator [Xanthobacteraceae bacterium]